MYTSGHPDVRREQPRDPARRGRQDGAELAVQPAGSITTNSAITTNKYYKLVILLLLQLVIIIRTSNKYTT